MKKTFCFFLFLSLFSSAFAQQKDEQYYVKKAPFKMTVPVEPKFANKTFSILDYGAVGDGQTLNTSAFVKAIDACTKAGGGKVIVPAGLWLTGPIQLQSNINLVVERGALIQFTPDRTQYPIIQMGGSNSFVVASPIYGYNLKNVAITGGGILDGAGESWRPLKKIKATETQWKQFTKTGVVSKDGSVWWPSKEAMEGEAYLKKLKDKKDLTAEDYLPARDFLRPKMVVITNSENVLLDGVTIRNSPSFVFYPNNCTNLTMRNVNIFNEYWAQNGDGIDISACKNVLIYKCNVSAGDDGICMKSSGGKNPNEARLENVVIAGCDVYHAHGGFVIGSNTDGGMNNVFVNDCNFVGTDVGIRVKSNAGRGGLVHNIYAKDIFMSDIVNEAVLFDTYYEDVTAGKNASDVKTIVKDKIPVFTDFHISNVYCRGAKTAIAITGLPEMPVQKIYFENVTISADRGYEAKDAKDIRFTNVKWIAPSGKTENLLASANSIKDESMTALNSLPIKPHPSIDLTEYKRQYNANRELWIKAFDYLRNNDLASLPVGRLKLAGDSVTVSVTNAPDKAFDSTKWESHQKFIDIQYIISGKEKMGVANASQAKVVKAYDEGRDVANYETEGQFYVADPSQFFIFFPQDAHRPSIKVEEGDVKKIVIKVMAAK
jgi:YhcH/YjgK/YiaL family protein